MFSPYFVVVPRKFIVLRVEMYPPKRQIQILIFASSKYHPHCNLRLKVLSSYEEIIMMGNDVIVLEKEEYLDLAKQRKTPVGTPIHRLE